MQHIILHKHVCEKVTKVKSHAWLHTVINSCRVLTEMKRTSSCNSALSYFLTACTCLSLAWPRRLQTCMAKWPSQVSDPIVLQWLSEVVFLSTARQEGSRTLWNLGVYKPLVIVWAFPVTSANLLRLPSFMARDHGLTHILRTMSSPPEFKVLVLTINNIQVLGFGPAAFCSRDSFPVGKVQNVKIHKYYIL